MFGIRGKTAEKIESETHAATYAERLALVQQRESERAAAAADVERLARDANAAASRVAAIKAELARAVAACDQAREALLSRGRQAEKKISDIDAILEKGADARIGELIEELQRQCDELRQSAGGAAVTARYEAALRGITRARGLQLEATEDIAAALAAIRAGVPSKWEAAA
jgi:hypothetical protein